MPQLFDKVNIVSNTVISMNKDTKHIKLEMRTSDPDKVDEAHHLTGLGYKEGNTDSELLLSFLDTHIELRKLDTKVGNGFCVNFSSVDRRMGAGNLSKKQPLPKAIGVGNISIIDTTAGFCGDAILLALMGFDVLAVERSPIISVLLRDAMRRAQKDQLLWTALNNRLRVVEGDAIDILQSGQLADVIYLDPMFPPKKKSSPLPPGHIQLLSQLVGDDSDAYELFLTSCQTRANRVVVKRPNYAQTMGENPVFVHKGKQVRFEVYTTKKTDLGPVF